MRQILDMYMFVLGKRDMSIDTSIVAETQHKSANS